MCNTNYYSSPFFSIAGMSHFMPPDTKDLYLDLLKKTLSDYLHIENDYANGIPPEYWWKKSWLKNLRNRLLVKMLNRSNMLVLRQDGRTIEERVTARTEGLDWPFLAETMVGLKRLENLQVIIEKIIHEEVAGDFIETGVWRGGASIFMRAVLKAHGVTDRKLWLCDSFEGLPPPESDKYPEDEGDVHHTFDILAVSKAQVINNFKRYGLLDDQVQFVAGYFENTLPTLNVDKLSLLRLDGDMYGSTIVTLNSLYSKVSVGGYVIIDDYGLGPCRKAVEDFRNSHNINEEIVRIDASSVFWQKTG